MIRENPIDPQTLLHAERRKHDATKTSLKNARADIGHLRQKLADMTAARDQQSATVAALLAQKATLEAELARVAGDPSAATTAVLLDEARRTVADRNGEVRRLERVLGLVFGDPACAPRAWTWDAQDYRWARDCPTGDEILCAGVTLEGQDGRLGFRANVWRLGSDGAGPTYLSEWHPSPNAAIDAANSAMADVLAEVKHG